IRYRNVTGVQKCALPIFGVIIAVYLLSLVEKGLRKVIPDAIDIIVTPTISLLVVGMMTIFLIMPIAGFVSTSLVGAINWVLQVRSEDRRVGRECQYGEST